MPEDGLTRVRNACLDFPEAVEKETWDAPTFRVTDKIFVKVGGGERQTIWCKARPGVQEMLVQADPERFFRPPYVGHRGWLGVRLDRGLDRDELAGIAEDAYAEVAPPKLVDSARLAD